MCAAAATRAHMPLLLKAVACDELPVLWRGMLAIALQKPGEPLEEVASYRPIALTEPS